LEFPLRHLQNARPDQWVLDPFCGCGTTLLAARMLGLSTIGVDGNPVSVVIARAKLLDASLDSVLDRAAQVLQEEQEEDAPSPSPFWRMAYAPETLRALCRFRAYFQQQPWDATDHLLCALLMGILHGPEKDGKFLSNPLPADFAPDPDKAVACWRNARFMPPERDLLPCLRRHAALALTDRPPVVSGHVIAGDSRNSLLADRPERFDWVVSSPPYYGMGGFIAAQWLRLWLLGGAPYPDKSRKTGIDHHTIDDYVSDLALVWTRIARICNPGAHLILRFGETPGVHAPSPEALLLHSLEKARAGWQPIACDAVPPSPRIAKTRTLFEPPAQRPTHEIEMHAVLTK
jgi:hypothetical protein